MAKKTQSSVSFSTQHGPISGTGNIALAAAAVCAANETWGWGIEPWWALAAAGGGLLISQIGAQVVRAGFASRLYRAACWMSGGAWTGYVLDNTVWDLPTVAAGVGLAFGAALAAPVVADIKRSRGERAQAVSEDNRRSRLAAQWQARLLRVCRIQGAQIEGIEPWKYRDPATGRLRKTGYTVEVLIPQGGQGWETITHHRKALAADLDLPVGCTVTVEQGVSTRKALIYVSTVNCLMEDIPLAMPEVLPASINDPLEIGLTTRGEPVQVPLKWASGVLVGAKRQGKSNLIKSLARQALRCDDVLIMGVDPNGGAAFAPFLRPWLEGKASRPAIDWVSVDEAEVVRMLKFVLGAVERRRSGYAQHMWENGGDDKLAVSHQIPHILILTDESKSLSVEAKKLLIQINDRGGAASVSMLTSWLRAIANNRDGLPRDLLVQSEIRLTVRVTEDAELKHAFSNGRGIPSAGEAPAPGWGHYRPSESAPAQLYKSARSTDQDAYAEAIATAGFRPLLDAVTIGPERELYEGRWERAMRHGWLAKLGPRDGAVPELRLSGGPAVAPVQGQAVVGAEQLAERRARRERWRERVQEKRRSQQDQQDQRQSPGSSRPSLTEEEIRRRFAEQVAGLEAPGEADEEMVLPAFLVAVLELLEELGTNGLHRKVLANRLTEGDTEAASALMGALGVEPSEKTFRMQGHPEFGSQRGWKRSAIEVVAEAIRGGAPVSLEVADWERPA